MENNTDFTFSCPHCGQHLKAEMDMVGTKIVCPTCGNAISVPQVGNPAASTGDSDLPQPRRPIITVVKRGRGPSFKKTWFFIAGIVLFVLCLKSCVSSDADLTIDQYTQKQIEEISSEVSSWAKDRPNVVQYVENKHGTVTVKDVQVKLYKVQTVDGGNVVRSGGKNIFEQTLVLRFWWDGKLHTGGHTDIGFLLDKEGTCLKTWTAETDAIFDREDPDCWYDIGFALGALLAL